MKNMENQTIQLSDEKVIIKRYKLRSVGNQKASIETTIPREAFEREARRCGMTTQEALTTYWPSGDSIASKDSIFLSRKESDIDMNEVKGVSTGAKYSQSIFDGAKARISRTFLSAYQKKLLEAERPTRNEKGVNM